MAACGPFMAGFVDGSDLLNDGTTANLLRLRIVNASGRALALSHADDAATRFVLGFRTGTAPLDWGLIEAQTGHLTLDLAATVRDRPAWQVDHHTLRRLAPGRWRPLEVLELEITVHSQAPAGEAQLILRFENLPHDDDGDLVLGVRLGPLAARQGSLRSVAPLELHGRHARLSFHPEEVLGAGQAEMEAPSISVNRSDDALGRLEVDAPAGLHVSGDLQTTGVLQPPRHFSLGGTADQFYPVVFEDLAWERGELRFELFRANAHTDGPWHGSMMAKIACHAEYFGHGSGYWSLDLRQWSASATAHKRFIADFQNDPYRPMHVVWLAGATTYAWRAEHPARIVNTNLANPGSLALRDDPPVEYAVRKEPQPGFDAEHASLRRLSARKSGGRPEDVSPVPAGAIVLWPGADPIPAGWAVCDGVQAKPDLSASFPPQLKYIRKKGR